jgi:putative nucleotidyltransferase with HDIG domain
MAVGPFEQMNSSPAVEPALEAQCRRIAAWSLALEDAIKPAPNRLPEIMNLAEALDEHFLWEPFSRSADRTNELAEIALRHLQVTDSEELDQAIRKLPVFPIAAQRAMQIMLRDDWNGAELESIAGADQALAANLLQAANSWAYSPRQTIRSLPHAIMYIGAERTTRILYAASIKSLFGSARLRAIWNHSLDAAQAAQHLAEISGVMEPKQAFLAGLVHDIGRLAMARLPEKYQTRYNHLTDMGCEPFLIERVLSGFSHGEAGARALKIWNFPDDFVEAVEFHHQPEKTQGKFAALLYLTEHWTDSCEDVPSALRFRAALERLGMSEKAFTQFTPKFDPSLSALCFAS